MFYFVAFFWEHHGAVYSGFRSKNTAFHNGSIKAEGQEDKILSILHADDRMENIYPQYVLSNVSVKIEER